ncbi:ATP-binding protein [Sorangium sp. So ce1182]|uniref:ATP-binding protein n=1 Tax=Sorangium sp. So ce1182 TaxID=3133334 RepID=UPI003F61EEC0
MGRKKRNEYLPLAVSRSPPPEPCRSSAPVRTAEIARVRCLRAETPRSSSGKQCGARAPERRAGAGRAHACVPPRRLRRYTGPELLSLDELGYVPCDASAVDLLVRIVSKRHESRSVVITTNQFATQRTCLVMAPLRCLRDASIPNFRGPVP